MEIWLLGILFYFFLRSCIANLVWGGDFQYDPGPFTVTTDYIFHIQPSNRSKWYDIQMGNIQIKKIVGQLNNFAADLSADYPYTLCQDIYLQIGKKYQIKYSLYCQFRIANLSLKVFLNNKEISTLYIPNAQTFANKTDYFYAQSSLNQLCFNQTYNASPANYGNWVIGFGGALDNITIYQYRQIYIKFVCYISEKDSNILLISNITNDQKIANLLKQQYILNLPQKQYQINLLTFDKNGLLTIQFNLNFSCKLTSLIFLRTDVSNINNSTNTITQFYLLIDNIDNQYFYALNEDQKQYLLTAKNISQVMVTYITKVRSFFQIFTCSYFILSLISFQNLSLFYIFLNIKTVPQFTKLAYSELLYIGFQIEDTSSWMEKIFKIKKQSITLDIQTQKIPEVIDNIKNGYNWFGTYGFTSLVFNNNIINVILLLLLVVKRFLIGFLVRFLTKKEKDVVFKTQFSVVLLIQIISMSPSIIISAVPSMMTSQNCFWQRVQKILQDGLVFICLILIPIYFIQAKKSRKFKQRKDKHCYYFSQLILLFTIPLFLSLNQPVLFLIINFIVMALKITFHFFEFKNQVCSSKIIQLLVNLFWLAHHCIFVFFYIIDVKNIYNQKINNLATIFGITVIITVISGCILQFLKLLIWIIKILYKIFKKIRKVIKKSKQQNNQKQKQRKTKVILAKVQQKNKINFKFDYTCSLNIQTKKQVITKKDIQVRNKKQMLKIINIINSGKN